MKSIIGFFCIISLLTLSCESNNWADSIITNDSDLSVTFKFNTINERIIEVGNSTEFKTIAYQHMEYYNPNKRVYFIYKSTNDGYTGQFLNRPSWIIKVNNAIGEKVNLSADGWMDIMEGILVGTTDDENHNGIIYTDNPKFSVETESGFPAIVKFNKIDNIFYVTIQWSP